MRHFAPHLLVNLLIFSNSNVDGSKEEVKMCWPWKNFLQVKSYDYTQLYFMEMAQTNTISICP